MKIVKSLIMAATAVALITSCSNTKNETKQLADYVNPMIGASTDVEEAGVYHGLGKTFPGATTPYGLVQVSPQTITGGDNGSGYSDQHRTIEGFAMTQMSGIGWFGDLGNFLVMPTTGKLQTIAGKEDGRISGYRSQYDKKSETAKAGYYSVRLTDYDVLVETTATQRCGALRFTYPQADTARIQIDLARRVGGTSTEQYVEVVDDSTIKGWMRCTPDGGGWGNGDGHADYTVYYYATFSKPIKDYGFWSAEIPEGAVRKRDEVDTVPYLQIVAKAPIIKGEKQLQGKHLGFFTEFPTEANDVVEMKVGISFVDLAGAENNYKVEIADKDFDQVHAEATEKWNKALSVAQVEGGTEEEKVVFYTSLYHTMIDPRDYTDADGRYVGGDLKVHEADPTFTKRTIFSGWDVFRSQFPLQTIINPRLVSDEINSLMTMAEQSGREYYERWEFLNSYSGCMIGNPALVVLGDAYVKGIRTYDAEKALQYGVNSSAKFGNDALGYSPEGLSVSVTLEYAYADWCLAQMAAAMGKQDIAEKFYKKAQAYRNVFNDEVKWFRPRNADGTWVDWYDGCLTREWYGCIEANIQQQGWFVPHDVDGLVELIGGKEEAIKKLNDLFANTPEDFMWNEYYNHANEPVHFVPFLYNRLGTPWETQRLTRYICKMAYHDGVKGLVGNEDVGQMSAWYVLTASGIHPSCPATTRFEITSPVFDKVTFALDQNYYSGKTFTVVAHNNSPENVYIDHATLNGKEYNKCYIEFDDIKAGATLELYMSNKPNEAWGTEE